MTAFLNQKRTILTIGLLFILIGFIFNERVLTAIFSSDGILDRRSIVIIWLFDIAIIVIGCVLVIGRAWARLIDLFVGLVFTVLIGYGAERLFFRLNHPQPAVVEAAPAPAPPSVTHEGDYAVDFFHPDPQLGYKPKPDATVTSIKKLGDDVVYDVVYTIDEYQRRVTPVDASTPPSNFLLFFGGSFVFGEGVNDDETFPYHAGRLAPQYQPYNYGLSGYGPQQMLAKLQSDDLATEVSQKRGIAIYTFIDGHVERAIGSMYVYNAWGDEMPYYAADRQGNLTRKGDFRTGRPILSTLYELLAKSEIATYYNLNIPNTLQDRHYEQAVRIIAAARDTFREKYESDAFYVLIYPDEGDYFEDMEAHFQAANLNVLNYDEAMKLDIEAGLAIKGDRHPTGEAHSIVAEWLVRDLEIGE